ncbi:hypothetical protein PZ897_07145 [Hoeflea sp. YIM 152468]|uniref:hypothetical protein n=1 Tax=Hoeflea sp. YIM 152468 TaxID=3031759 RepID=UPI0023DACF2F|nr:hypothetical protein [Hoeflea sp. YIM 152468]MDF1607945.1 hypothetical protein [Hoeflea sp. YIM 152468]
MGVESKITIKGQTTTPIEVCNDLKFGAEIPVCARFRRRAFPAKPRAGFGGGDE